MSILVCLDGIVKRNHPRYQEENCRPPQLTFILGYHFQMPENATFICSNSYLQLFTIINSMGTSSHHTTLEGDSCCVPGTMCFGTKCAYNPHPHPKKKPTIDLEKMLAEAGKRLSLSTVKGVL